MRMQNKTVLVTGGTSGIGRASVELFASEGATVFFTGRRQEEGEALVDSCRNSIFIRADHTRVDDCKRVIDEIEARVGHLDVLFNNAGIVVSGTAEEMTEEVWDSALSLNVKAVWRMSALSLPLIRRAGGGSIINNASDWGIVGGRRSVAYTATKGAVIQLTRSMALDHARENIRVNAVCPGDTFVQRWIDKDYFQDASSVESGLKELGEAIPMGRVGRPEEIAAAVLFLASSDASFITGVALPVDGGNTAQ